jgi:hypothetical protein
MRERLFANGGVIAQCEFGPGADPENVLEVFRTWRELDGRDGTENGERNTENGE